MITNISMISQSFCYLWYIVWTVTTFTWFGTWYICQNRGLKLFVSLIQNRKASSESITAFCIKLWVITFLRIQRLLSEILKPLTFWRHYNSLIYFIFFSVGGCLTFDLLVMKTEVRLVNIYWNLFSLACIIRVFISSFPLFVSVLQHHQTPSEVLSEHSCFFELWNKAMC